MAVYERGYRRYTGPLTATSSRFLILPRYALGEVFRSRLFVAFFVLCYVLPFSGMILIYLRHNLAAMRLLNLNAGDLLKALPIGAGFFMQGLTYQGFLALIATVTVAPALVSPDLRNNGLALYLSRPFSRTEYAAGKMSVLVLLLSLITWVPGLVLFLLQAYLEGSGWLTANLRTGLAIFVGSWVWILALSLLGLTVSAWVKWRPVARITLLILYFVLSGFAGVASFLLRSSWPQVLSLRHVIHRITSGLFDVSPDSNLPLAAAWVALVLGIFVCAALLSSRLRAYEVVR